MKGAGIAYADMAEEAKDKFTESLGEEGRRCNPFGSIWQKMNFMKRMSNPFSY